MNDYMEMVDNCRVDNCHLELGDLLIFPAPRSKPLYLLILQEHEKHRSVYLVFDLNHKDTYQVCLASESFMLKKANRKNV